MDKPIPIERFSKEKISWIATVRPDGRPHLTPVWHVTRDDKIYICVRGTTVKAANLAANPNVACSLEDGYSPIICEGRAVLLSAPWPADVVAAYKEKYDWDLSTDPDYNVLVEITPTRWLQWN